MKPNNVETQNFLQSRSQNLSQKNTFSFFGGDSGTNVDSEFETEVTVKNSLTSSSESVIPNEFLDEITHELMQIPMIVKNVRVKQAQKVEIHVVF